MLLPHPIPTKLTPRFDVRGVGCVGLAVLAGNVGAPDDVSGRSKSMRKCLSGSNTASMAVDVNHVAEV